MLNKMSLSGRRPPGRQTNEHRERRTFLVSELRAPHLLRWLVYENHWDRLARCKRCGIEVIYFGQESSLPCPNCLQEGFGPLGLEWWTRAAARIRRACARDRSLLAQVRTEWEADRTPKWEANRTPKMKRPVFRGPFEWLREAWIKAGKHPGRTFEPHTHYMRAHIVDQLRAAGVA